MLFQRAQKSIRSNRYNAATLPSFSSRDGSPSFAEAIVNPFGVVIIQAG
jgi:hypothetical protein